MNGQNETTGKNAPSGAPDGQNSRRGGRRGRKSATDSVKWLEDREGRGSYRQQFVNLGGYRVRIA